MNTPPNIAILDPEAKVYADLLSTRTDICITQAVTSTSHFQPRGVDILLASPRLAAQVIEQCHQLVWCQSTWAGNNALMDTTKQDYQLTGLKGVFSQQMAEFVFGYLLYFARNIEGFNQLKKQQQWRPKTMSYTALAGKTLAILGTGDIASGLVTVANSLQLNLIGMNSNGRDVPGFSQTWATQDKLDLARHADFVVSILPDTPATTHLIDSAFLAAMPPKSIVINCGRGNAIDDDALIEALHSGHLAGAVLDVFRQEPLPASHAYWNTPNLHITHHTAAESKPEDVIRVFEQNLTRYLANAPLMYTIDFAKGY